MVNVEAVRNALGKADLELVNIEDQGEYITVKFKQYQPDKSVWDRVNNVIRGLKGEWISNGKQSRWQIQKDAKTEAGQGVDPNLKKDLIGYLEHALEKARQL